MNLKNYTLSVSLAVVVGLLVTVVPLVRNTLEYRSPESVDPRAELVSFDTFLLAHVKGEEARILSLSREAWQERYDVSAWHETYNATKEQHVQSIRQRAAECAFRAFARFRESLARLKLGAHSCSARKLSVPVIESITRFFPRRDEPHI